MWRPATVRRRRRSARSLPSLSVCALVVAPSANALKVSARAAVGLLSSVVLSVAFTYGAVALVYFGALPVGFISLWLALGASVASRVLRIARALACTTCSPAG